MGKSKTLSFVTELPLIVDSRQESELLSRFQAARQLYNACLNEAMARMELVRESVRAASPPGEGYQAAKKIPRENKKQRTEAFSKARTAYRYSDYDIQAYATLTSNNSLWIAEKVDSNTQQTLAKECFSRSAKKSCSVMLRKYDTRSRTALNQLKESPINRV